MPGLNATSIYCVTAQSVSAATAQPQSDVPAARSAWGREGKEAISNEKRGIGKYNKKERKKGPSCKECLLPSKTPQVSPMPWILILMPCPVVGRRGLSPSVLTHPLYHFAQFATLDQFAD